MRRSDREITDLNEIADTLSKCEVARIAAIDDNEPYIVALNFGLKLNNNRFTLYFHGAKEGRKASVFAANPRVCFQADRPLGVIAAETICKYSFKYESVVGWGVIKSVEDSEEKSVAIGALIDHYGKDRFEGALNFDSSALSRVFAWKIEVDTTTAKRRFA